MDVNDTISQALDTALGGLRVATPGRVTAVGNGTVDVQPLIKIKTEDGHASAPLLVGVPVVQPAAGGYTITFPIAVGDTVLVVYQDRAIDGWADKGEEGVQVEYRAHHPSDAIAIIGLFSPTKAPKANSGGLEIEGGGTKMTFDPGGTLEITSGAVNITGCDVNVTGGDVIADGVSLKTHKHGGVTTGTGNTDVPI